MNHYPDVVARIADDYLERVKVQLRAAPARERVEVLREVESHIYESYWRMPAEDDVARILAVLRKLGEPAEVVADRLPGTMMSSGTKRNLPVHLIAGILIALFGVPLGFGGAAVVAGALAGLAAFVVAYYAAVGAVFLTSLVLMLLGMLRIYNPASLDKLVTLGVVHLDRDVAEFAEAFAPGGQGLLLVAGACAFAVTGVGMLWLGRHLVRGLRFLFSLAIEWVKKLGQKLRKGRADGRPESAVPQNSLAPEAL